LIPYASKHVQFVDTGCLG